MNRTHPVPLRQYVYMLVIMESDCYCTNLRATTRSISAIYDAALAPVGINVAQWGLLRKLDPEGLRPVSIGELADRVGLERSTVARNLRVLTKDGFVHIGVAADDRRASAVVVTEQGQRALHDGAPLWETAQRKVEELLNGADTAAGFRTVLRFLQTAA